MIQDTHQPDRSSHVDRGLRWQLRIFLATFAIVATLMVVEIIRYEVKPLWALGGIVVGVTIGVVLARTKVLHWNQSERTVVATTDVVGGVILAAYLLFLVLRSRIIGSEVHNAETVQVIGLAITAGAMLGRVVFTLRGMRRVLAAVGIGRVDSSPNPPD